MKKTLAALAVLGAFAGSAMAADVNLYGIVDVGFKYVHSDPDENDKDATDNFTMATGNQSGSRFGLKGVEDLGNGVQVGFVLENGFSPDDGTLGQGSRLFGREANLFVRGAFGELSFGRLGALDSANGSYGLLGYLSPFGASWAGTVEFSTFAVGGARMDNTVTYKSPNFAGFNAYAQYSLGMNTKDKFDPKGNGAAADLVAPAEGKSGDNRYAALGATYVAGPVNLAASAALYNWSSTEFTDEPDDGYTLTAGGYYDCGFAKTYLGLQYFDNMYKTSSGYKDAAYGFSSFGLTDSFKGWSAQLGFDAPLAGGTALVAFGYADAESANSGKDEKANDNEFKRWGASVGYTYSLSKRTNVYGVAGYYQDKKTDNVAKSENKPETTTVIVGVRHKF